MSIQRIAKQALSAYARSKSGARRTTATGMPTRNRPIRSKKIHRGRSAEGQIAAKAIRSLRKAF
ncbi:hypothetical protein GCM10011415_18940 [Salipiger pallidus]|uniref:Uncharacterized protein n=1 Tax=Salipiger pallidus TaxID=1775170 RepID=A0A8J3EG82_9RHOB|nr:hypothetical protein [Salipiger pallidus]GGG71325.1 hypothetical protein GCM10011415_18940 [Salipiger pallidus]